MQQINYYLADDNRLIRVSIVDGQIDEVAELECASIVEVEEDTEEEEPEEEEEVVEKVPKPKAAAKKSEVDLDKAELQADIRKGMKPKDIAAKHGISAAMVYYHKSQMKKEEGPTTYQGDDEEAEPVTRIPSHASRIKYLVNAGESDETIYAEMHDLMTDAEFRAALAEARNI